MSKIVCVVPTVRPAQMESFFKAWTPLFRKHKVTLLTVWDGEKPDLEHEEFFGDNNSDKLDDALRHFPELYGVDRDLFCTRTDACRNIGFVSAAVLQPDYILTLDDDVVPCTDFPRAAPLKSNDPIQEHLDVLQRKVPISWMNTAHDTDLYLRGFPYGIREEAPVMLSHGVWVGTPDFDGETQLKLEEDKGVPHHLPYFVGPIPKGVSFPLCGMNVMIRKEALPYFYFAPMGRDVMKCSRCDGDGKAHGADRPFESSGTRDYPGPCPVCMGTGSPLNRFADIFMGINLKHSFDRKGWACYTGASTVLHTRASDAKKNVEQEKLGREWIEHLKPWESVDSSHPMVAYFQEYRRKRERYEALISSILKKGGA